MDFQCIQGQETRASDVAPKFQLLSNIHICKNMCLQMQNDTQRAYRDTLCVTKSLSIFVYYLRNKNKKSHKICSIFSGKHVMFTEIRAVASVKI